MNTPGPLTLKLEWKQGRALASDGLNGFNVAATLTNAVVLRRPTGTAALGPGQFQTIGWVRLDESSETDIRIVEQE